MSNTQAWRTLHVCEDLKQARAIVTSIAAMEFDARLRDAGTGLIVEVSESECDGPLVIEVPSISSRNRKAGRLNRLVMAAVLIIVMLIVLLILTGFQYVQL